jgi:hypothetical protein
MLDYDHLRGFLHDDGSLYWSYGGIKGRRGSDWQAVVRDRLGVIPALPALLGMGFDGIWVDTHGYEDLGADFTAELERELRTQPLVSENGRLRFYDLRPYKRRLGQSDAELRAIAERELGIAPPAPDDVGEPPDPNTPTPAA